MNSIESRLYNRAGHFFNEKLLVSQFETYEKPKNALAVSIQGSPVEIVAEIVTVFDL